MDTIPASAHWNVRLPKEEMYSPPDMDHARAMYGAACGHGALAAVLGIEVRHACRLLDKGDWINVPIMKAAIERAGFVFERVDKLNVEQRGLILIQFLGPWCDPGRPPAVACQYRHWVAARNGWLWDSNWPGWQSQKEWKAKAVKLLPDGSRGLEVWGSLVVKPAATGG